MVKILSLNIDEDILKNDKINVFIDGGPVIQP
ncbi:hypothetical protein L323_17460 [Ruminiclostridium papyrosolvens C7]|uniref:Uncharacterized protein n=1 Tax=Ruminiclostridium papyrosolvens C7 TaxID=1330534 RepID=U4QZ98_9FIRM|nr:hypothetical protein L323_17460 [Ruminiclostridium papyrosolvens C7]